MFLQCCVFIYISVSQEQNTSITNFFFLNKLYFLFLIGSDLIQMNWLLRIIAVEIKMHVHQNLLMSLTKLVLLFIGIPGKKK